MRLPKLSFGIGLCSFVLFSDNVSRNSCMLFCSFCYGAPLGGPNGAQLLRKKRLILVQPSVYMYHVSSTRDKLKKINK